MKPFNVFPYDSNIDFMRLRWVSLAIVALLLLGRDRRDGAFKGFNFALDFTGGVSVELRYDKVPDVDGVRARLDAAGYEGAQVQSFGSGNDLLVRLQAQAKEAGDQVSQHRRRGGAGGIAGRQSCGKAQQRVDQRRRSARSWRSNGVYALLFVVRGLPGLHLAAASSGSSRSRRSSPPCTTC